MTNEQEQHLQQLKDSFVSAIDEKFRAGVREHGGTLHTKHPEWLIAELKKEAVDLWAYADTLERRLLACKCRPSS